MHNLPLSMHKIQPPLLMHNLPQLMHIILYNSFHHFNMTNNLRILNSCYYFVSLNLGMCKDSFHFTHSPITLFHNFIVKSGRVPGQKNNLTQHNIGLYILYLWVIKLQSGFQALKLQDITIKFTLLYGKNISFLP